MEKLKFKDLKIGDIVENNDPENCHLNGKWRVTLVGKGIAQLENCKDQHDVWAVTERCLNHLIKKGRGIIVNKNKFTHKDVEVGDTIIIKGYESFSVQKTGGNTKPYFLINSKTGWYASGGILDIYFQKGEAKLIKNKEKAEYFKLDVDSLTKDMEALNSSRVDRKKGFTENGLTPSAPIGNTDTREEKMNKFLNRKDEVNKDYLTDHEIELFSHHYQKVTGKRITDREKTNVKLDCLFPGFRASDDSQFRDEPIKPKLKDTSMYERTHIPLIDENMSICTGTLFFKDKGPAPVTKDVGSKRSNADNKPRVHDFLPYTRLRFGYHMLKGSFQNGIRNFSTGYSKEMTEDRIIAGIHRHITAWEAGDRDEDNLSAIIFGAQQLMIEEEKKGIKPDHYFKPKTDKS